MILAGLGVPSAEQGGGNARALDATNRAIRRSRSLPVATTAPAVDLPTSTDQATLRTRIEIELNFEGHRWFDLVRTDRAIPVMNACFTKPARPPASTATTCRCRCGKSNPTPSYPKTQAITQAFNT